MNIKLINPVGKHGADFEASQSYDSRFITNPNSHFHVPPVHAYLRGRGRGLNASLSLSISLPLYLSLSASFVYDMLILAERTK